MISLSQKNNIRSIGSDTFFFQIGSVEDLEELSPSMANSFHQLLEYDGDDFQDTFSLT